MNEESDNELTWHAWYGYKRVEDNSKDDSGYIKDHESSETKGH